MKTKLFPASVILTVLGACSLMAELRAHPAQPPPALPHCYVEANGVSDRGEIARIWQTSWGSYIHDRFQGKVLKIRVGTTSRIGGDARVQCFWIGRNLANQEINLYGREEQVLNIPAGYFAEFYVKSPELKSHVSHLVLARRHSERGNVHEGWIVCVRNSANRILQVKASSETMLKLFEADPMRLPKARK